MKLKFYPTAIIILGLALLVTLVFFNRYEISVQREPVPEPETSPSLPSASVSPPSPPPPSVSPTPTPNKPPPVAATEPDPSPLPDAIVTSGRKGSLRISNQTDHPVRVALLPQPLDPAASNPQPPYDEPVHWDFAPEEGSNRGLRLSLPDGDLQIQEGDILVAFAQDGSRRYWGPFVVGKTALPAWNQDTTEWQLILQP